VGVCNFRAQCFHLIGGSKLRALFAQHQGYPPTGQTSPFVQIQDECRPPDYIVGEIGQTKRQRKLTVDIGPYKTNWSQHLPQQTNQDQMALTGWVATSPPVDGCVNQHKHANTLPQRQRVQDWQVNQMKEKLWKEDSNTAPQQIIEGRCVESEAVACQGIMFSSMDCP
jgi:hypothetical protein